MRKLVNVEESKVLRALNVVELLILEMLQLWNVGDIYVNLTGINYSGYLYSL